MRKLFSFYKMVYCYMVLILWVLFTLIYHYTLACLFVFIEPEKFHDIASEFEKKSCKIAEDKIKEIKESEFDILNADLHERCLNGEYGLKLRHISWWREIIITILLLSVILFVVFYMKNC